MMIRKPAIFLDRDGVINENPPNYVKSWQEFHFLPGVLEAMRLLAGCPWPVVVISNQSPLGRGLISTERLDEIHDRMRSSIVEAGGRVDGLYVCPHTPEEGCDCRKPQPGLLLQAAEEMGLDLRASALIGDSLGDVQAALRVDARPMLVRQNQTQPYPGEVKRLLEQCWVGRDLTEAAAALIRVFHHGKAPADVIYCMSGFDKDPSK